MATEVDIPKLNQYLHGKIGPCSFCHKTGTYSVVPTLMELREYQEGSLVVGGKASLVPLVVLTCSNCGHTVLINAVLAGLVKQNSTQDAQGV